MTKETLIREATDGDVEQIRDLFLAVYGEHYAHPQFYDLLVLKRMVFTPDTLLLVATDKQNGKVLGTASVLFDSGAHADLVGEFGRLVVHPDARGRGIGNLLMEERLARIADRLQLAAADCRVVHPLAQRIAIGHGFAPVGFLPQKLLFSRRESLMLLAHYFGDALKLRRNNPHIIPEVFQLAELAMRNCGLECDAIVEDEVAGHPYDDRFELDELTTEGYTTLLHFQRGRVRNREVFGPVRLHYGLFKLRAKESHYLLAKEQGQIIGAIGFTLDQVENTVRIFEIITLNNRPIRFLLNALEQKCVEQWHIDYMEVDVNAHAPRMQRTLLELGYLPAAYIPALVFHEVERLDGIRMVRLLVPPDLGEIQLEPECKPIVDLVMRHFVNRQISPRITEAIPKIALFAGLNSGQAKQLASRCHLQSYGAGEIIFKEGDADDTIYLLLEGEIEICTGEPLKCIGGVDVGECLGEMSLLTRRPHSATIRAKSHVETALLGHDEITELVRLRPDIGVVLYRNLAEGLGHKLKRSGQPLND